MCVHTLAWCVESATTAPVGRCGQGVKLMDGHCCCRRVETEGVCVQLMAPRRILLPAMRHPHQDQFMQVSVQCCGMWLQHMPLRMKPQLW